MGRQRMPSTLPSAVERRELIFGRESKTADHGALAARYEEQGRLTDALEFYAKAGDESGIEGIRRIAVRTGDAFLLAQVVRTTGEPEDAATWRETAQHAEREGKTRFAVVAYREAGDEEAAARLTEVLEAESPSPGQPAAAAPAEDENQDSTQS